MNKSFKNNVLYSVEMGHYKGKSGKINPNYGNRKLSKIYAENKEYAKQKQSRPGAQNGKAHQVALYDENWNYINTFDCLKYCAEYLIEKGYSKSNPCSLSTNLSTAISKNKLYLKHHFKTA